MYLLFVLISMVAQSTLTITSRSFNEGELIPSEYTCEGSNTSPELSITHVPQDAKTLVLFMFEPDAPGSSFDHWISFDIIPAGKIKEGAEPGVKGTNSNETTGYAGPCPPTGTHSYHFVVYALDTKLNLSEGASRKMVEEAMTGHIMATGKITGLYKKK